MLHQVKVSLSRNSSRRAIIKKDRRASHIEENLSRMQELVPKVQQAIEDSENAWTQLADSFQTIIAASASIYADDDTGAQEALQSAKDVEQNIQAASSSYMSLMKQELETFTAEISDVQALKVKWLNALRDSNYYDEKLNKLSEIVQKTEAQSRDKAIAKQTRNATKTNNKKEQLDCLSVELHNKCNDVNRQKLRIIDKVLMEFFAQQNLILKKAACDSVLSKMQDAGFTTRQVPFPQNDVVDVLLEDQSCTGGILRSRNSSTSSADAVLIASGDAQPVAPTLSFFVNSNASSGALTSPVVPPQRLDPSQQGTHPTLTDWTVQQQQSVDYSGANDNQGSTAYSAPSPEALYPNGSGSVPLQNASMGADSEGPTFASQRQGSGADIYGGVPLPPPPPPPAMTAEVQMSSSSSQNDVDERKADEFLHDVELMNLSQLNLHYPIAATKQRRRRVPMPIG